MSHKRKVAQQQQDLDPFRKAEKKYKLYKNVETDFTDVIDLYDIEKNTEENKRKIVKNEKDDLLYYSFEDVPGLYFIKNPFTQEEQEEWIKRVLNDYIEPPNKSNLDPFHGPQTQRFQSYIDKGTDSLTAKLRWVTLGYHYNWTDRVYNDNDKNDFPTDLAELASKYAELVGYSNFKSEAAIINFYNLDSNLCGHLDNVEKTMEMPIVSISFGCSAVFLIGGTTKEKPPTAILVRSGDIVIMAGNSRQCYHGVPRILPNKTLKWKDDNINKYMSHERININIRQVY